MTKPKAAAIALTASFSVYLIPIVGPHAAWFMGEILFQGEARKSPQWMAINCAVAVTVQLLAAALFYWFFRRPGWPRGIVPLIAFPFVFVALQRIYMVIIPTRFLEEPDTAPETASWPLECTAPGAFQTDLRTPSDVWVRFTASPNNYAVLAMPGCRLAPVNLPQPTFKPGAGVDFSIDPTFVIPGGRAVVRKYESKSALQSWWLVPGAPMENGTDLIPIGSPPRDTTNTAPPILSTDGQWAAWLEVIPNTGPPVLDRVVIRPLDAHGERRTVDLISLGPSIYYLKKLDMQSEEIMLWRRDRLLTIGFDGAIKKQFAQPAAVRAQQNTFIECAEFWLAWDAYQEDAPYMLEWSLPSGSGSHRVPLGRSIHSAAVDPAGKWIAVSVGTSLNIGKAEDAVYVLSATDGHEVFRKYLPPFTRSPVAFLNGGFLAYSDLTGVRVLRVPK
jgi:hypothetical protein